MFASLTVCQSVEVVHLCQAHRHWHWGRRSHSLHHLERLLARWNFTEHELRQFGRAPFIRFLMFGSWLILNRSLSLLRNCIKSIFVSLLLLVLGLTSLRSRRRESLPRSKSRSLGRMRKTWPSSSSMRMLPSTTLTPNKRRLSRTKRFWSSTSQQMEESE